MHRLLPIALGCAVALSVWGCNQRPAATDGGVPDVEGLDMGPPDAVPPALDAAPPAPDAAPPVACLWPADCPMGDCIDGFCAGLVADRCVDGAACPEGQSCGERDFNFYCVLPCELDRSCPLRPRPCEREVSCSSGTTCNAGRCINDCVIDTDCAAGGHCIDGECMPFPDVLDGAAPRPLGLPGQLYAGVGVAPVDLPIGVSMAGYGGREGPQTPYQEALGGSDRMHDQIDARALVLTTDDDLLIVLRLPLGWSTDYLRTLIAVKLQALTRSADAPQGVNYVDKLVTVATHSHSGPGRFWVLLPDWAVLGHGVYSPEMIDRYASSFARAIKRALDDLQPARFGYTIIDGFDPEAQIHRDRRGESPQFVDDRFMLWRVEDLEGNPMMAAVNFAMHGTFMKETWLTGDSAGGLEMVATEKLSARAGRYVPVMFLNGNAGNISPSPGAATDVAWGRVQAIGHRAWPIIESAWDAAVPAADVDLEVVSTRIPINYDLLGYDRTVPDFRDPAGRANHYGGLGCVPESPPDDYSYVDGQMPCLLTLELIKTSPMVQVHKTALTAFRIDRLVVNTLPGEPTSELGMQLSEWVETDALNRGLDVRALTFGYSQDHQLYLLTPEDWFRGGYEAFQNWFGWNLGIYVAGESRLLARTLFTPQVESHDTGVKPTWWPGLPDDRVEPTGSPDAAGRIVMQAPEQLDRGRLLEVRWTGGHPGVDLPWVVLERADPRGGYSPVERSPGVLYDSKGFESLTVYRGNYDDRHQWAVRWEFPFDFPLGTYRLRMVGTAVDRDGPAPYVAVSGAFELTPATLSIYERTLSDGRLAFKVTLPDGPTNDRETNAFDKLEARGHLLRVDPLSRFNGLARRYSFMLGPPLADPNVVVRVAGGSPPQVIEATPEGLERALVTSRDADGQEEVEVIDWFAHRVEVDLPGPGAYAVFVEDTWANQAVISVTAAENSRPARDLGDEPDPADPPAPGEGE